MYFPCFVSLHANVVASDLQINATWGAEIKSEINSKALKSRTPLCRPNTDFIFRIQVPFLRFPFPYPYIQIEKNILVPTILLMSEIKEIKFFSEINYI